jgi:hypothetical protein
LDEANNYPTVAFYGGNDEADREERKSEIKTIREPYSMRE